MAAYRLPKATPEERDARRQAIQAATREAARMPLTTAERAVKVLEFLLRAASSGNPNALTDAAVGAAMAYAAVQGAAANVRVNCGGLEDAELASQFEAQIAGFEAQARELLLATRRLAAGDSAV